MIPRNPADLPIVARVKKCYVCDVEKPVDNFARKRNGWDTRCKDCRNNWFRERYNRIRKTKKESNLLPIQRVIDVGLRDSAMSALRRKTLEAIISDIVLDVFTENYGYE
ncbi:MAG: hypothetical protein AB7T49_20320 [Oligoflexales bacterium]